MDLDKNNDINGSSTGGMALDEDAEVQVHELNNAEEHEDSLAQEASTKIADGLKSKQITDSIYLMEKKDKKRDKNTGQL